VEDCFFVSLNELNPELFGLKSIKKAVALFLVRENNPWLLKGNKILQTHYGAQKQEFIQHREYVEYH